jgi:ABC-type amino acid transport system permease subunit
MNSFVQLGIITLLIGIVIFVRTLKKGEVLCVIGRSELTPGFSVMAHRNDPNPKLFWTCAITYFLIFFVLAMVLIVGGLTV